MKFPEIYDSLTEMQYRNDFEGALAILEVLNDIVKEPGLNLVDLQYLITSSYDTAVELSQPIETEDCNDLPIIEDYSKGILDS